MAIAMVRMSASVPEPFMALQPHRINLVFFFVYPFVGLILSTLGENGYGPFLPFVLNFTPVISQRPVQRLAAHSLVNSNTQPFSFERAFAERRRYCHG